MSVELIKMKFKIHKNILMIVLCASVLLFSAFAAFTAHVFEAKTSIYVHKKIPDAGTDMDLPDFTIPNLQDHVKIIKSNMVLGYVSKTLNEEFKKHEKITNEKLGRRLRVVSAKNTKVLELSFQDNNREYAARVLDATLEGYEDALKQIAEETKVKSHNYIRDRIFRVRKQRDELSQEIANIEGSVGTTDISKKNEELLNIFTNYKTSIEDLSAKIIAAKHEISEIQDLLKLSKDEIKALSRLREDTNIKMLQEELGRQQAELFKLKSVYTDKYGKVAEKKRNVSSLEKQIETRVKEIVGKGIQNKTLAYGSGFEQDLGSRLLTLQVELLGLQGKKSQYEVSLKNIDKDFSTLAHNKKLLSELDFKMNAYNEEESKLLNKLQDSIIEKETIENIGVFTIITPPEVPAEDEYIFPPDPITLVFVAVFGSIFLSIFSVWLIEYVNPTVFDLGTMPVFAEIDEFGKAVNIQDVQSVYQHLSLIIKRDKLRIVSIFHLCGALTGTLSKDIEDSFEACPYSPSVFARQLSGTFAEKNIKTLLVDCSDCYEEDELVREKIGKFSDYTLYQYSEMDYLHILTPDNTTAAFFDPNILNLIPQVDNYDLIILNASLSDNSLMSNLISESAEGIIVGISKTKTSSNLLNRYQQIATSKNIKIVGSILFP